ncbi:hypothetical protein F4679DRAFT_565713 [Xylaria curta]|nr:hypothetical protein F4679DRAFT_565713 [Xylaria curta]
MVRLEAARKQLSLHKELAATEDQNDIKDACHMEFTRSARVQDSGRGNGDSIELGSPLDPTSLITRKQQESINCVAMQDG